MSFQEGWHDRRMGRSFPKAYEKWTPKRQLSYEAGRRGHAASEYAYPNASAVRPPRKFDLWGMTSQVIGLVSQEKDL